MERLLLNVKVERIREGRYRGICQEISDLTVEGSTAYETITATRSKAQQILAATEE
jgi:hypothetical protein